MRQQSGAAAVDFALICIPLFTLILGMLQYGWYFYAAQTTSSAASSVARRVAVGDCWGSDASGRSKVLLLAKAQASTVTAASHTSGVNGANLDAASPGDAITVTVASDANILNFLPVPNAGSVTRTVVTRLEDKNAGAPCP